MGNLSLQFRPDIQGLRAVSVLAVILFHFNPAWLPGGFVGVDVFLVISGFLIFSILSHQKTLKNYTVAGALIYFYRSRFQRIAPAYFSMLSVVTLLTAVLFLPQDFNVYIKGLKNAAYFNSNNHFAVFGDYFAPANNEQPLLHTWSLAVELQFYLIAPFVFLLLPRLLLKWLLPIAIFCFTAYAEQQLRMQGNEQATYYSLAARLPAFFMGAWVANLIANKKVVSAEQRRCFTVLAFICIGFSFVYPKITGYFPGIAGLIPMIGVSLILWTNSGGKNDKLLSNKVMVWIGSKSYSFYLWHWPVLAILRYYTGEEVLSLEFGLLFVILTICFSLVSFYLIEQPLRANSASLKIKLAYAFLLISIAFITYAMKPINAAFTPAPLGVEYTRYADPATICHGQIVGDCLKGDLNGNKEVLVLGDSHAAMLNHFFDYLGKELSFKARIITASSCVTVPGFDSQRIAEWAREPCLAQIDHAKKYLNSAQVIFIAASWNWQLASDDFQHALSAFLTTQSMVGSKIYLLEQEPLLSNNPLRAMRFHTLWLAPRVKIDPAYHQANAMLNRLIAKHRGVTSLNFESSGIFAQVPFADGMPIYLDEHHLNEVGAKRYAVVARNAFSQILD